MMFLRTFFYPDQTEFIDNVPKEIRFVIMEYVLTQDMSDFIAFALTNKKYFGEAKEFIENNITSIIFTLPFENAWQCIKVFRTTELYKKLETEFLQPSSMQPNRLAIYALTTDDVSQFEPHLDLLDSAIEVYKVKCINKTSNTILFSKIVKSLQLTSLILKRGLMLKHNDELVEQNLSYDEISSKLFDENKIFHDIVIAYTEKTGKEGSLAKSVVRQICDFPCLQLYSFYPNGELTLGCYVNISGLTIRDFSFCHYNCEFNVENCVLLSSVIAAFNSSISHVKELIDCSFLVLTDDEYLTPDININEVRLDHLKSSMSGWKPSQKLKFSFRIAENLISLWKETLRENRYEKSSVIEIEKRIDKLKNHSFFKLEHQMRSYHFYDFCYTLFSYINQINATKQESPGDLLEHYKNTLAPFGSMRESNHRQRV